MTRMVKRFESQQRLSRCGVGKIEDFPQGARNAAVIGKGINVAETWTAAATDSDV